MIVHDFHFKRIRVGPAEADAPLIVDSNAVLSFAVTPQSLETVARNSPEIRKGGRRMNLIELPFRNRGNALELSTELAPEHLLRVPIAERSNHDSNVVLVYD